MKPLLSFLYILRQGLKAYWKTYLLFFLITIISLGGVLFFYNASRQQELEYSLTASEWMTVTLDRNPTWEQIQALAGSDKIPFGQAVLSAFFEDVNLRYFSNGDGTYSQTCRLMAIYPEDAIYYGRTTPPFSQEQVEQAAKVITIPSGFESYFPDGTVSIYGESYEIVGTEIETGSDFWVPCTTLLQGRNLVDRMEIALQPPYTRDQLEQVEPALQQAGISYQSVELPEYTQDYLSSIQASLTSTILMYLLVVVTLAYLYFYLLQRRRFSYGVFRMLGLSKLRAAVYLWVENLLWFCLCFVIALPVAAWPLGQWLTQAVGVQGIPMFWEDIFLWFLLLFLITGVVMLLVILRYLRAEVVQLLHESEGEQ